MIFYLIDMQSVFLSVYACFSLIRFVYSSGGGLKQGGGGECNGVPNLSVC